MLTATTGGSCGLLAVGARGAFLRPSQQRQRTFSQTALCDSLARKHAYGLVATDRAGWDPLSTPEARLRQDARTLSDKAEGDAAASCRAIENLIAAYAERVDDGDFAAVGELLAHAEFTGAAGTVRGREAMAKMLFDHVIIYQDGTPRTKHLITNVAIDVDEAAGTASARSYFTILQSLPDQQPQVIVSGRYSDRFERRHESWRFVERQVRSDLVGDTSRHIRPGS